MRRSDSRRWRDFLEANGYESDIQLNTVHGSQRLLHYDAVNSRQVPDLAHDHEVFVGAGS